MIRSLSRRDRAFVLLVALGVLGVLGLLAATFATLSRVERAVSNSYVDKVRAKMLAQSGIERAIASIRGRAMIQAWDDSRNDWYYREMLNAAAGALNYTPEALAIWAPFAPNRPYGTAPRSLEAALDAGIVNGTPAGISYPDVANPAVSGRFPGTYEPDGDVYALKVLDCASMVNVNDGSAQVVRVLNNLGSLLKCADGTPVSTGGFQLGTQIQTKAVARGKPFNNKSELLSEVFVNNAFFGGNVTEARKRYDAVKDFVTCHGWVDGMTVRFNNTWTGATDYTGGSYASAKAGGTYDPYGGGGGGGGGIDPGKGGIEEGMPPGEFKADPGLPEFATSPMYTIRARAPGVYPTLPATRILAAPALPTATDPKRGGGFRQYVTGQGANAGLGGETKAGKWGGASYSVEPRTPINVNTCSKEVLVACLMDVEASFWDYEVEDESKTPKEFTSNLVLRSVKISKAEAEAAADHILSGRYTFGTPAGAWAYNDWMHVEDEMLDALALDRFQRALIKVVANPNTQIKKMAPDLIMVQSNPAINPDELVRMDKSDVKVGSLDWTFSSNGFYEIEAVGRVYNSGRVIAEEKIETVVKLYDVLRYTTQEQLEQDRAWATEDSKEGDLLAGGYPPIVSMPEYAYSSNPAPASHYRSSTGDVSWCADYDGYLVLNGPAKVIAGQTPGPAAAPAGGGWGGNPGDVCWGPRPPTDQGYAFTPCAVSFVAGFNMASLYPQQSHRGVWHRTDGTPPHPEYAYSTPHCFGDGGMMNGSPLNSHTMDTQYTSAWESPRMEHAIDPLASGADFWDGGCDLTSFGVYMNAVRRNRFHTYWADEVPAPDCTIEMTVKPEVDLWNWATQSKIKTITGGYAADYQVGPCSRQYLFDWGVGGTYGMNYTVRCYVQLSRVYLEFNHTATGEFRVMYADHQWKPHTWHHVEVSFVAGGPIFVGDPPTEITIPPNAMLFVDGVPASGILVGADVNTQLSTTVYDCKAVVLPEVVMGTQPNNDVGTGPRFDVGSHLQDDGSFGMSQPAWHGLLDNVVMHHWRSHDAPFTPRNRYHSVSYYDGATWKSGTGYKLEKAGVYKKRLTYLESVCATRDVTVGTLTCTHYHPFHVHLYGHDGSAPTTSFGHITPALRIKSGGSYVDAYYYDGCAGLPIKSKVTPGSELYYMGWFEVASLVPVTMSPVLCDFTLTYFVEPVTYYRMSSAEARR